MIHKISGYNPLPLNVRINNSELHGMGVFATENIDSNHDFGITHVVDGRFKDGYIRTPFGGFINHSFSPNCEIYEDGDTLHIKTIREVKAGEELTIDYRPYYPEEVVSSFK